MRRNAVVTEANSPAPDANQSVADMYNLKNIGSGSSRKSDTDGVNMSSTGSRMSARDLIDKLRSSNAVEASEPGSEFKTPLPVAKNRIRTSSRKSGTASVSFSGVTGKTSGSGAPSSSTTPKYSTTSSASRASGGCASTTSSASSKQTTVIVALSEGRGKAKGEVGIASFDLRHPELVVTQISDSAGYSKLRVKLQILNPIEIVFPDTASLRGGQMSALIELLRDDFPQTQITTVHRKYFNYERGKEDVARLRVADCSSLLNDISEKYYCLASVAALVKYIEHIQNIIMASGSVKITYSGVEKTCMIDPMSVKYLELIVSLKDNTNSAASLNGILDTTATGAGARMLRASILQPPADRKVIGMRLDAVQELLTNEQAFRNVKMLVGRLVDVDQLIGLCMNLSREETIRTAEYKLTQIIYLKHSLELVENLRLALAPLEAHLFKMYRDHILCDTRLGSIVKHIHTVLHDEVHCEKGALNMRTQKCFAIKPGLNGLLDVARRTYTELVADVDELGRSIAESSGMPFRTGFSSGRGFHLILPIRAENPLRRREIDLPEECICVARGRTSLTCTTRDLIKINDRISQSVNEIFLMSSVVVTELLAVIRGDIGCLYNLTEAISVLDMILSIANYSSLTESVRPEFSNILAVKKGRHPLLEHLNPENVKANDIFAGPESSFIIVTGPNMAGKSTYLKQVGLLQVMAQAGCFVPAEWGSFLLCDQIFTRIGHNDDLEKQNSAFMVEMKDMAYIIRNVSPGSLVIIDELGRATSTEEGVGISHAICEHLISVKPIVFFATHFLELMDLDCLYSNVENYHFNPQSRENEVKGRRELVLDHCLKKGPYRGPLYGLEFAEVALLPDEVLSDAKVLAQQLRDARTKTRQSIDEKERLINKLGQKLIRAADTLRSEGSHSTEYLVQLKKRFAQECLAFGPNFYEGLMGGINEKEELVGNEEQEKGRKEKENGENGEGDETYKKGGEICEDTMKVD